MQSWSALILAAGAGRRFGAGKSGAKLLAPLAGAPVIRRTVEAVLSAGLQDLVVATGAEHEAIAAALEGLACRLVPTHDWDEGMAASLRTGLAALAPDARGVFVFLGDMPLVPVDLCSGLAIQAEAAGYAAPAAFTRAAVPDLARLSGDIGAAALLKGRSEGVAYIETEAFGAVLDIDSPADLAAAERAWNACATSATSDSAISRGALPKP